MDQTSKILKEILSFCTRWQLDTLHLVNSLFYNLISNSFSDVPYRHLRQLNFRLLNEEEKNSRAIGLTTPNYCTAYYRHQIKSLSFSQAFEFCSAKNIRFGTTYVCIDADCDMLCQFGEGFFDISHVWKDQTLVIDMDSRSLEQRQIVSFYSTLFATKLAVTQAKQLVIVDRNYAQSMPPHFYPFKYKNLNDCESLVICAGLSGNLVDNIVAYLHESREQGSKKKLCYSFMYSTGLEAYNMVQIFSKLSQMIKKRFTTDTQPFCFVLWCLNVFLGPAETNSLLKNVTTNEMLQLENKVSSKMRNSTHLEESAFQRGSTDVCIKRFVVQPIAI